MTVINTAEAASATRRRGESNGSTYWVTTFLGANRHTMPADAAPPAEDAIYPMAFLVEQDAAKIVQPHFHQADQFQVVVGGAAKMGTHDVAGIAVHFSARFTAYGPIAASAQGVQYFTLRNGYDPGAQYMPGARQELKTRRTASPHATHREAVVDPAPTLSTATLAGIAAPRCTEIMPMAADGLAAWRYCLPPGAPLTGPDPSQGRGQNWLVLAGTVARTDVTAGAAADLGIFACLFVFPDDPALALMAGPEGAELLCMQYPQR